MGIEELVARLERDAQTRVTAIEQQAEAQIAQLAAEGDVAASLCQQDALLAKRRVRRARLDRELSEARQRARVEMLKAQHALVDRVMARASELFDEAGRGAAYLARIPSRIEHALRFAPEAGAVVRCRPELATRVRAAVAGRSAVVVEEIEGMAVGISVAAHDGSMEVDDTLPSELARRRVSLAIEVLEELAR